LNYASHLLVLVSIYVPLVLSLRLLVLVAGLPVFSQALLFGVGAYAYALMTLGWTWPPAISFLAASLLAVPVTIWIGQILLKFSTDDVLLVVSIALQVMFTGVVTNATAITNGPFGLTNIPGFVSSDVSEPILGYVIVSFLACIVYFLLFRAIDHRPFGVALRWARDDEPSATAMGFDVVRLRLAAFAVCGSTAAASGAIYAAYTGYIEPSSFSLQESIFLYTVVLLGGTNISGAVLATTFLLLLPELLRFLGSTSSDADFIRNGVFGSILIAVAFLRPLGLSKSP